MQCREDSIKILRRAKKLEFVLIDAENLKELDKTLETFREKEVRQSLEDWKERNYSASTEACSKRAERCFKRIQKQKKDYSADTADKLSQDINAFVQNYCEENLGPA